MIEYFKWTIYVKFAENRSALRGLSWATVLVYVTEKLQRLLPFLFLTTRVPTK